MKRTRRPSPLQAIRAGAKKLDALATRLDGDPKIRVALIARLNKAAETAPVVLLHSICQMLEMDKQ